MKQLLFSFFLLLLVKSMIAQVCHCPLGQPFCDSLNPIKVFSITNEKSLELCGYIEVKNSDTIYQGIACIECRHQKIIDEWDETERCRVEKKDDTLFITELYTLPIGKGFKDIEAPFYVYKLY